MYYELLKTNRSIEKGYPKSSPSKQRNFSYFFSNFSSLVVDDTDTREPSSSFLLKHECMRSAALAAFTKAV